MGTGVRVHDPEALRSRVGGRLIIGRADAGGAVGWGHARRLGALLAAWCEVGGCAQLMGDGLEGAAMGSLADSGVEFGPAVENLAAYCLDRGACASALDGYQFSRGDVVALQQVGPVLAIDDLAGTLSQADLVVNQNLDFPRDRYTASAGTVLIGSDYVLLQPEFRQVLAAAPARERERVLVTFGGADPAGLSLPVCEELCRQLPVDEGIDLVLGPGVSVDVVDRCEALSESVGCRRLAVHRDVASMSVLMRGAAVAIAAAGSTTWELMAMGVAPVLVTVADNQRPVAVAAVARGAAVLAGADPATLAVQGCQLVRDGEARAGLVRRGRELIDGQGVWRVLDALLRVIDGCEAVT